MKAPKLLAACIALSVALVGTAVVGQAGPAQAAYPTRNFQVNGLYDLPDNGSTDGTITWYNRTANVKGAIWSSYTAASVTVHFDAFAGSNLIDPQTRTYGGGPLNGYKPFNFPIGDSDLPGGINRIRITVCADGVCGGQANYSKPNAS